jgi:hypothetical protein
VLKWSSGTKIPAFTKRLSVSKHFMTQSVIDSLREFSKTHDLLQTTIKHGIACLENWMKESPDEHKQLFPELPSTSFIFNSVSQQLIFFQHEKETFIVRTKYALFTDKQRDKNIPVGWYALDVNQDGEVVDDWFHLD